MAIFPDLSLPIYHAWKQEGLAQEGHKNALWHHPPTWKTSSMKLRLVAEAYSWQMRHICYYHHYHTLQQGCTLRSKKNMWPHFRWQVERELSVYKGFGTLITETIGHRQVFSVSHLTYLLVQLLYLGKLSRPKCHGFSLKLLIFRMLVY